MQDRFFKQLQCIYCKQGLHLSAEGFLCERCKKIFVVRDGTIFFTDAHDDHVDDPERSDAIIFKLKLFLKKYPKLFLFLYYTLGTFVGKSAKKSIAHLSRDAFIINLGSGVHRVRDDVVNIDIAALSGVDVVADVYALPLKDNSVDAIIAECLVEHLKNPVAAVAEIHRVLRPGGLMYLSAPFIIGYHSSPGDYQRWTTSGLRELLKDFEEQELGIAVGPTNTLTYILREWLATVFSFNSRFLYQAIFLSLLIVFAPFNLLDHLIARYASAKNIAHIFYYIGIKRAWRIF